MFSTDTRRPIVRNGTLLLIAASLLVFGCTKQDGDRLESQADQAGEKMEAAAEKAGDTAQSAADAAVTPGDQDAIPGGNK